MMLDAGGRWRGKLENKDRRFYVYLFIDPRDGIPFNVGKGQGKRGFKIDRRNEDIVRRIKELDELDLGYLVGFIARNLTEEDAYGIEDALIAGIGRKAIGTGPLLNRQSGHRYYWLTPEELAVETKIQRKKRKLQIATRILSLEEENELKEFLRQDIQQAEALYGRLPKIEPNPDIIRQQKERERLSRKLRNQRALESIRVWKEKQNLEFKRRQEELKANPPAACSAPPWSRCDDERKNPDRSGSVSADTKASIPVVGAQS